MESFLRFVDRRAAARSDYRAAGRLECAPSGANRLTKLKKSIVYLNGRPGICSKLGGAAWRATSSGSAASASSAAGRRTAAADERDEDADEDADDDAGRERRRAIQVSSSREVACEMGRAGEYRRPARRGPASAAIGGRPLIGWVRARPQAGRRKD
jgi:hypothetical protein